MMDRNVGQCWDSRSLLWHQLAAGPLVLFDSVGYESSGIVN